MLTKVDKYVIRRVREMRIENGLSQYDLALGIDVDKSFISRVESGKYDKKYNVSQLNEIAKVLKCSPKDFQPNNPL